MADKKFKSPGNIYSSEIYAKMKKYQKKYGFEIGTGDHDAWNNEADAFKHTFGAVDMALKLNAGASKLSGDFHEYQGRKDMGQKPGEENMDKWNNAEGRKIAQKIAKQVGSLAQLKLNAWNGVYDDMIANEVMKKMRKGELITHPNDTRKYNDTKSTSQKLAQDVVKISSGTKSASQKFSDQIRADFHKMRDDRNKRILGKNHPSNYDTSSGSGNGRWVTIRGRHVYIEN